MNAIDRLVRPDGALANLMASRSTIMALTQASGEAVLSPRDPGGLPQALRAAIAVRAAESVRDDDLSAHYREALAWCEDWSDYAPWCEAGSLPEDPRLAAILRHGDLLAEDPRRATRADVEALAGAGVAEADIVRLAELAAFLGYQARLLSGLRLLKGAR